MFLKPSQKVVPTYAGDYVEWHQGRTDYALWYLEIENAELLQYLNQLRTSFSDLLYTPNTRQFHITLFICGFLKQSDVSASLVNFTLNGSHTDCHLKNSNESDFLANQHLAYVNDANQQHIAKTCAHQTSQDFDEQLNKPMPDDFSIRQLQQQLNQLQTMQPLKFQLSTGRINSFESALFVEVIDPTAQLQQLRKAIARTSNEIAPLNYCPHITIGLYKDEILSDDVFQRIAQIEQASFEINIQQLSFGSYQAQLLQGPLTVHHQFKLGELCCD